MEKEVLYSEIKKSVKSILPETRVLIYGSYARNEENENSDVDIMIISDNSSLSEEKRREVRYAVYDIEIKYGIILSPKVITATEWDSKKNSHPFYESVRNEGVEI